MSAPSPGAPLHGQDRPRDPIPSILLVKVPVSRYEAERHFGSRAPRSRSPTARSTTSATSWTQIGDLCEYVRWDQAWIGCIALHPPFRRTPTRCASPRSRPEIAWAVLHPVRPQQGAGFSQASQIQVHDGKAGEMLWDRCLVLGIETRRSSREFCHYYAQTGRSDQEKWFFDHRPRARWAWRVRRQSYLPGPG